jgi:putative two-component system response regulator
MRGSIEIGGVLFYGADIFETVRLNQQMIETQKQIVYAMGEIGENRSKETGDHVRQVA